MALAMPNKVLMPSPRMNVSLSFMGLPFGRGGLRNLHPSQTGNPAFFSHPRRHQLARLFDSPLSLQTAVRGQVHGFGRAGAAGCLSSF